MDAPQDPRHPANHGNEIVESVSQAEVDNRRGQQAGETDDAFGTPTTPALPHPMGSGMVKGGLVGAIVGAVLLTPLAFANILDLELPVRLVVVWIAGAAAGAALGGVFFGGAKAEMENRENDEYIYADGAGHDRREGPGLD